MAERTVTVPPGVGLHARPAALFVRAAAKAPVEVTIAKPGGDPVTAKSILSVLGLDVRGGQDIVLRAEGEGAEAALDDLVQMVTTPEQSHG